MTMQEILESTILYYGVNPDTRRCIDDNQCMYSPTSIQKDTSEGCAIGRLIPRRLADEIDKFGTTSIFNIMTSDKLQVIRKKLPKWMLDIWSNLPSESNFLMRVQNLHDASKNWTAKGISGSGCEEIDKIITDFGLKQFDYKHLIDKESRLLYD